MLVKRYISIITSYILCVILLTTAFSFFEKSSLNQDKKLFNSIAANKANLIVNTIESSFLSAYETAALVVENDGNTDFFDEMNTFLYSGGKNADNDYNFIAVAPDGVVEKIYPSSGDAENMLGFNYWTDEESKEEAEKTNNRSSRLLLENPVIDENGNYDFVGKLPVFLEKQGSKDGCWGLVVCSMDFNSILKKMQLSELYTSDIKYSLYCIDDEGNKINISSSEKTVENPIKHEFNMKNLKWGLELEPANGWYNKLEIVIGMFIILGVSGLIVVMMLNRLKIKYTNKRLKELAYVDNLSLCFTRHYINSILINNDTGEWKDPTVKYSVVLVDIDNFKHVNDTYGHQIGDRAIVSIAKILNEHASSKCGDCVIRHGGDEFVLLYNDVTEERFKDKLISILSMVRKIHFNDYPELKLTVSMGGVYYKTAQKKLYYDMITEADKKLYEVKNTGRNSFKI